MADAECTAHLLIRLEQAICERYGLPDVDPGLLLALQRASKHQLERCVSAYAGTA